MNVSPELARLVVWFLGVLSCLCVIGIAAVAACGHEPPADLGRALGTAVPFFVGLAIRPEDKHSPGPKTVPAAS